jgi:putative DNA primase/helicase
VRRLFADFDKRTDTVPDTEPKRHVVVSSSPGKWHVYWRANGVELSAFSAVQEKIARLYNSDPAVKDLPRVMRLPGFLHRKGEPCMVRIVEVNDDAPACGADDFASTDRDYDYEDRYAGTDTHPPREPSPWAVLNALALRNLEKWMPELFGDAAVYQPGTKGYRVSSKKLGRDLEEDLSINPSGIKDWGVHDIGDPRQGRRSPIDLVMEFRHINNVEAFHWLDVRVRGATAHSSDDHSSSNRAQQTATDLHVVLVSEVEAKPYNWLWKSRIARGKVTLLVGMPDVNKSTLAIDLTARITRGDVLPAGEGKAPLGNVVVLSAEDDVADTIRPRLEAAGADLDRVHVVTAVKANESGGRRTFDLTTDITQLELAVKNIGDVIMIVIDPYSAYMGKPGKLDCFRSTDVRATLTPLFDMAARLDVTVLGIGHLNKSGSASALMRVLDSVAFVAASRGVYLVVRDPEDDSRRLFLPAKNNIGRIRTGLAFKVVEKLATTVFDCYPIVKCEDDAVSMTADEALAWREDGRRSEVKERAKALILEMLANGTRKQQEVEARAMELGISLRVLKTAKKELGVTSNRGGTIWWWTLPGSPL